MASLGSLKSAICDREERKMHYQAHIRGLNAFDRHNKFMHDYVQFYGKEKNKMCDDLPAKTDKDTIREGYRFILSDQDDMDSTWEKRLVKRYYDKLFKEYCIADMSQYRNGKVGLRWRTEKEVVSGKGQFICGNKKCNEKEDLGSYEVNFLYFEAGENKQALVKLVACKRCAEKLAYRRQKEKERLKDLEEDKSKRKRGKDEDTSDVEEEYCKDTDRRKKGRRSLPSQSKEGGGDDQDFEEYLEGMFP